MDTVEDRIDLAESRIDQKVDRGRWDVAEDKVDTREDRADAAGYEVIERIGRHDRRTWWRILRDD
ncbi:hypothetical protein [Tabrizicola sp.]|uniref:hypothetical protein n=1 Tax=Tabrizicola sp. TaxID=2005166 RepID=UPI00273675BF|nr:hypothetical protein [Tabrizicola sp.]MDP3195692.1 hypothetical protein [Tabrizicola sp.]